MIQLTEFEHKHQKDLKLLDFDFNSSLDATGCVALGSKFYLDHVGRIDDTLAVSLMSVAQGIEIVVWTMDEGEVEESL